VALDVPGGEFGSLSDMVRRGAQDGDTDGRSYARYVDVDEDGVNRGERVEASFLSTPRYQCGGARQRSQSVGSLCASMRQ